MSGALTTIQRWLHAARARLGALLSGRRLDRELDEEMRFHLEQATRKNRLAGMSEDDARRAAEKAFGSLHRTRDLHRQARGTLLLDDLRQDVVYGMRRLRGRPWITLAAVATLGLGIGAVTTVYSAVQALLVEPVPFADLDRIVVLGENPQGELQGEGWAHAADVRDWSRLEVFDAMAPLARWFVPMVGAGEPVEVIGYRTTPELFRILGVEALHGRTPAAAADGSPESEVVLSHRFWRVHLGADPAVIGTSVRLDGQTMTVVGVLPPGAEYPMGTDLWGPLHLSREAWSSYESSPASTVAVVARLAPGTSLDRARAALRAAATRTAEAHPDSHGDLRPAVLGLLDTITYGTRPLLVFLMGAAACLLLLVCANVANLQLMGATTRRQEVALRTALGAGRTRLVRQLLTESLCLGLLGAAAGAMLAIWGSRLIRSSLAGDWWRFFFVGVEGIDVDLPTLGFALATGVASTVAFGVVPALRGTRVELADAIKTGAGTPARGRGISRHALVVVEVALSIVLVWGALLMVRATGSLADLDLGLDDDVAVLTIRPRTRRYEDPAELRRLLDESLRQAGTLPGVVSAALADHVPGLGMRGRTPIRIADAAADSDGVLEVRTAAVAPGYLDTLGVELLAGRSFEESDREGGVPVAIVSQGLARLLQADAEALGSQLVRADGGPPLTVVGIVADVLAAYNDPRPRPTLYLPAAQLAPRPMQLLLQTAGDGGAAELARDLVWRLDPTIPLPAVRTVGELVAERAAPVRMATGLMGGFAVVALLLCLGGVHAVVAYAASLRTREVGVRMALGAARSSVARLFGLQGLRLCAIGVGIGLPLAYAFGSLLSRGLTRFLPSGGGVDPLPLATLAVVVVALGAVAGWLPGRRAARTDPAATLRTE